MTKYEYKFYDQVLKFIKRYVIFLNIKTKGNADNDAEKNSVNINNISFQYLLI